MTYYQHSTLTPHSKSLNYQIHTYLIFLYLSLTNQAHTPLNYSVLSHTSTSTPENNEQTNLFHDSKNPYPLSNNLIKSHHSQPITQNCTYMDYQNSNFSISDKTLKQNQPFFQCNLSLQTNRKFKSIQHIDRD